MRVSNDFDWSVITNLIEPITGAVSGAQTTIQNTQTSLDQVNKNVTFLNKYYPEILIGVFLAIILGDIIANKITR